MFNIENMYAKIIELEHYSILSKLFSVRMEKFVIIYAKA